MTIPIGFTRTLLFSAVVLACGCAQSQTPSSSYPNALTRGVYGNPGTLLEAGYGFDELGMNAIFVRSISLNQKLYDTAKAQGAAVHVEFPTLLGRGYVENHPEALPIDETGTPSPQADWFMGVCPTHPGFKAHRKQQLKSILDHYQVDGIFLDYVHWHAQFETTAPILPNTCFCDRCVSNFADRSGIEIPAGDTAEQASALSI